MAQGVIRKALSGFYYVQDGETLVTCRARGKFRLEGESPLVGDRVTYQPLENGTGFIDTILPRRNRFLRPAVANIDQLVIVVSQAPPAADPFLIDQIISIAESRDCAPLLCVNKCDLEYPDRLAAIYTAAGIPMILTSAATGEGVPELAAALEGKINAFTGNTGVGKSSLLNAISPVFHIPTGEISEKLGRGRHTTRHIEFFRLGPDTFAADTPGFSSFDIEQMEQLRREDLAETFREFRPYLDQCRFRDCTHRKEKGCAVRKAVSEGIIPKSRHASYVRIYDQLAAIPDWEREKTTK